MNDVVCFYTMPRIQLLRSVLLPLGWAVCSRGRDSLCRNFPDAYLCRDEMTGQMAVACPEDGMAIYYTDEFNQCYFDHYPMSFYRNCIKYHISYGGSDQIALSSDVWDGSANVWLHISSINNDKTHITCFHSNLIMQVIIEWDD